MHRLTTSVIHVRTHTYLYDLETGSELFGNFHLTNFNVNSYQNPCTFLYYYSNSVDGVSKVPYIIA